MYFIRLILTVYLILGSVIPRTNGGLLDSLGGAIGLGVNSNQRGNNLPNINNNFIPNFNPNVVPNPNNFIPNMNNNNGFNNGRNNNYPNGFNNGRNNNLPNNNLNNNRNDLNGNMNDNRMRFIDPLRDDSDVTTRRSIFNPNNLELTEKEKIAVQKFPELQNLLDKLKEMNKQKELEKQNKLNKSTTLRPPTPDISDNNHVTDRPVDEGVVKLSNGWKLLKKRKFFFKVQPIRPENEIVAEDEIMYFLD